MMDRSVPCYPVIMTNLTPKPGSVCLPEGYRLQTWSPGRERDWCRIQCEVEHFAKPERAWDAFRREFAPHPSLLGRRLFFVCGPDRVPVATAMLWRGKDLGEEMERVHWVASSPAAQGRGLCKALMAALLNCYVEEGCQNGIYLTSQTVSYKAIGIYQSFGFTPYWGPMPSNGMAWNNDLAWSLIEDRLSAYRHAAARERTG